MQLEESGSEEEEEEEDVNSDEDGPAELRVPAGDDTTLPGEDSNEEL